MPKSTNANAKLTSQQLRGFVAVWVGITMLIGLATFVAIYVGTGSLNGENKAQALSNPNTNLSNSQINTSGDNGNDPMIAIAPDTDGEASQINENGGDTVAEALLPQETEEATEVATEEATTEAVAVTPVPTYAPTTPAIEDLRFDLGVQMVINPDPVIMAGYFEAAANQLRLNWVKLQIRWEFVEPEPGVYDWAYLDTFFAQVPNYNIRVMASMVSTPDWAREQGVDLEKHGPPADYQTFANFVATVLTRYPGRIHAVEVWNEMNLDREWTSTRGIVAADYVAMLRLVSNTIGFIDPNIIVISGAPSPTGITADYAIDDFTYVDQLIAAGVLDIVDCFGVHHNGYNIGPRVPFDAVQNDPTATFRGPFDNPNHSWSFYTTLTTYANKIQATGSSVPLCITEFGWATTEDLPGFPPGFEFANDNSLAEQGIYITNAITQMEEWGFVWLAFLWNLNFGPEAGFEPTDDNVPYSLIRPGYFLSPAWGNIAEMDFRGKE